MWEGETWRGITFGGGSSLLGKQKHYRLKEQKQKNPTALRNPTLFYWLAAMSSGRRNATAGRTSGSQQHTGCWGKVGQKSRSCFLYSLDLWRHQPAPPRSCEISTYLHCCNNKIAFKNNNEDNTLNQIISRNHSYSMYMNMNIICKYKFHLIKKCW